MPPRLNVIAGPLSGTTFDIDDELSIGRGDTNHVCVDDRAVSRKHCVISRVKERFRIRDLGSHNLTYVNNQPVQEQWLENLDEIRVGRSIFIFQTTPEDAIPKRDSSQDLDASLGSSTIVLRREDALYLDPNRAISQLHERSRAARDLECLLQAADILCAERTLETLSMRILSLVGKSIPTDTAAILLAPAPSTEQSYIHFHWARRPGTRQAVPHGIVNHVMKERVSVWTNDAQSGDTIDITESVLFLQLSAVLAVPLVFHDRVLGVILAATIESDAQFEERDLQLLTGIAGFAAGSLDSALHLQMLEDQNRKLQASINAGNLLVGESPSMQSVQSFITKVAPANSTVLITGESGTGKELVARALHRNSSRNAGPFVAINCAALTETLLESELFGHEKGAFTGAVAQKKGKLEEANGGTVFLDEIGELAPTLQAKLLRVLQERELERVGGTRTIKVDIRLITATNRDLHAMVKASTFRQDLFYRLNVVSIAMPPLRSRRGDISLLALHFVQKHGGAVGRRVTGISKQALDYLLRYEWPGNVRELENVIERAIVLGSTEEIMPDDLPESVLEVGAPADADSDNRFHELVNDAKRRIVLAALEASGGSYTEAARQLGIHANNLHRLIRNLNIKDVAKR